MTAPWHGCRILALTGCTATGKSAVAQELARREGLPILSADAMQVYRGMDVGTAKIPVEQRNGVEYFGLDCVSPRERFSVGDWLRCAREVCQAAAARERPLIVVGGTGLYFQSLFCGLDAPPGDPERRNVWQTVHAREGVEGLRRHLEALSPLARDALRDDRNPRRLIRALECAEKGVMPRPPVAIPASANMVALRMPREVLRRRIVERVSAMVASGWLDETARLRAGGSTPATTAWQAIGYPEMADVLDGHQDLAAACRTIVTRTSRYAKRQETWFRHRMQPIWIDVHDGELLDTVADRVWKAWNPPEPSGQTGS